PLDAVGSGLGGVAGWSLVWARRYPWPVVTFGGALFVAYLLAAYAGGPMFATLLIGLFWLGDRAPRQQALAAAAAISTAVVAAGLVAGRGPAPAGLVFVGGGRGGGGGGGVGGGPRAGGAPA